MVSRQHIAVICQWVMVITGITLVLITVVFLAWASNKGFDITDEGFYLLSSQFPNESEIALTAAHHYTSFLYRLSFQNVIVLRIVGLILALFSAAIFSLGFQRLLTYFRMPMDQAARFSFEGTSLIFSGAMLYYIWFLPTPSYNSLNGLTLTAGSGLFFLSLAGVEGSNGKGISAKLALFCVGFCIGVSFFVKFPTGISLFALFTLVLSVWPKNKFKIRLRALAFIALGLILWSFFHFLIVQSPANWWRTFRHGLGVVTTFGGRYDIGALRRYFYECLELASAAFMDFWELYVALALGFLILALLRRALWNRTWLPSFLVLLIFACAVWQSYQRGFYLGGMSYFLFITRFYLSWLMLLTTAIIALLIYNKQVNYFLKHANFLAVVLSAVTMFFLPFVGAVGTGNYIYAGTFWYMAPWFGLLAMLFAALTWLNKNRWILSAGVLIIISFTCAQIISGCWYEPYRLNKGLFGQTDTTEIGYPTTLLKLDPATSTFFNEIRYLAWENGFKPGDDLLGFFNLPGVVFALGGRSPGIPWYNSGHKDPRAFTEKALSLVPQGRLKRAFILQTSGCAKCMPDLSKFGINFPNDYIFCGEVIIPYPEIKSTMRLWKPKFLSMQNMAKARDQLP